MDEKYLLNCLQLQWTPFCASLDGRFRRYMLFIRARSNWYPTSRRRCRRNWRTSWRTVLCRCSWTAGAVGACEWCVFVFVQCVRGCVQSESSKWLFNNLAAQSGQKGELGDWKESGEKYVYMDKKITRSVYLDCNEKRWWLVHDWMNMDGWDGELAMMP